jgi:hypothetical protein
MMSLSLFSLFGQVGRPSNFFLNLLLDLFGGLLREFPSLSHHVDFFVSLRVRLQ